MNTSSANENITSSLRLRYPFFRRGMNVLLVSFCGNLLNQVFTYNNSSYSVSRLGHGYPLSRYIGFFFINQVLIECVTIFILFRAIIYYAGVLKLSSLNLDARSLLKYELSFLPLFLCVFFIFNPLSQSLRFLLEQFGHYSSSVYLHDYWYSFRTYMVYLGPVTAIGYLTLNINLLLELQHRPVQAAALPHAPEADTRYLHSLSGTSQGLEKTIEISQVSWIGVEDRQYYMHTTGDKLRINKNLNELESLLNPDEFIRVNRSAIVNIRYMEGYAHVIKGKYVLMLKDKTEFTLSLERAKHMKAKLKKAQSPSQSSL